MSNYILLYRTSIEPQERASKSAEPDRVNGNSSRSGDGRSD